MSTVKCIKRSKDKNGEEQIEYMVQFDYVSYKQQGHSVLLKWFWTLDSKLFETLYVVFIIQRHI